MASSRNNTTILWASAASKSIAAAGNGTSDAFSFNAEDWEADIQLKADNDGTPQSGDTLDFYILWGPDSSSYDTVEHAEFLCRFDTYATDTPGEDPAALTLPIRTASKSFKLYAVNNSAGRAITVSAIVSTHRGQ